MFLHASTYPKTKFNPLKIYFTPPQKILDLNLQQQMVGSA